MIPKKILGGILDYCVRAKVKGIINFDMGVTLRDGNREYFYKKLDEHFPGLKECTETAISFHLRTADNLI